MYMIKVNVVKMVVGEVKKNIKWDRLIMWAVFMKFIFLVQFNIYFNNKKKLFVSSSSSTESELNRIKPKGAKK